MRRKRRSRRSGTKAKPVEPNRWSRIRHWPKALFTPVGGAISAAATLAGILSLFPRISVEAKSPAVPADPFSVPFVITNDGLLPMYNIEYAVHVKKLTDAHGRTLQVPLFIMPGRFPMWRTLLPGDSATIVPPFHPQPAELTFTLPLQHGELDVDLRYHYGIWPFRNRPSYRFVAMTFAGHQVWIRQPSED